LNPFKDLCRYQKTLHQWLGVWTRGEKLSWRGPIGHRRGPTSQNSEKS